MFQGNVRYQKNYFSECAAPKFVGSGPDRPNRLNARKPGRSGTQLIMHSNEQ